MRCSWTITAGQQKGRGISIFRHQIQGGILSTVHRKITELEKEFGTTIILSRINGKRWGFVPESKKTSFDLPVGSSHKIQLDPHRGYIIYGWDGLEEMEKGALEAKLREETDE